MSIAEYSRVKFVQMFLFTIVTKTYAILFHDLMSKTTFVQVFEIKIENLRLTSSVFSSEANNLLTFIATGKRCGFNYNVLNILF